MNKTELVAAIAEKAGIAKKDADKALAYDIIGTLTRSTRNPLKDGGSTGGLIVHIFADKRLIKFAAVLYASKVHAQPVKLGYLTECGKLHILSAIHTDGVKHRKTGFDLFDTAVDFPALSAL